MRKTNINISFPRFFYIFEEINSIKYNGFHFPLL